MLATALALLVATLGAAHGAGSGGPPSKSEVSWTAPRGCPTQPAIVAGVEALLGESLEAQRAVMVRAQGRVERVSDDRWVLRLRIWSPTGERDRELEGSTCQELGEVAIVLVAVAIDPSVDVSDRSEDLIDASSDPDSSEVEDAEPEVEDAEPAVEDAEPEVVEEEAGPERRDRVQPDIPVEPPREPGASVGGSASVATGLLVGPLPGVAPGLRLSLGLRWRLLAVAIGGSHWFERKARLPATAGVGGDLQLTTGDIRLCVVPSIRRLELPLCTGAELGALTGRGVGVTNPRRRRALWAAWVADAGATFMPWRWVGFGVRAGLVVPFTRSTFALDGVGSVHEVAPVGLQALGGIEFRFP